MKRDELSYALYILAGRNAVPGLCNPDDDNEREEHAVRIIRAIKEDADMPTERDRAETATVATVRPLSDVGRASLAFAHYIADRVLSCEQRTARERPAGITFFRSRTVNVAGRALRLKWAV